MNKIQSLQKHKMVYNMMYLRGDSMVLDYEYVITKKNNTSTLKKYINTLKLKNPSIYIKQFTFGEYTIFRMYKDLETYNSHNRYNIEENRDLFLELECKDITSIKSEIVKEVISKIDLEGIVDKDQIMLNEDFSSSCLDKDLSFIILDKKNKKVYLGLMRDNQNVYYLKNRDEDSYLLTNSEYIKTRFNPYPYLKGELNPSSYEIEILNELNTIYEIDSDNYFVHKILKKVPEEKTSNIEPSSENIKNNSVINDMNEENNNKLNANNNTPSNAVLRMGNFLDDKVYTLDPSVNREKEIELLQKYLLIPNMGVILVGKTGVGKTAIVEGLAYRIKGNNVCDSLKNKKIFHVSLSSLVGGTRFRGDLEQKVDNLCKYLEQNQNIILFLDEIHGTIGSDKFDSQSIGISEILKPYISDGSIKVIGCTTDEEFDILKYDSAFLGRFNILDVEELEMKKLKDILLKNLYFNSFNINIDMTDDEVDRLLDIIIKLSSRRPKHVYVKNNNPKSSINILNYCFANILYHNKKSASFEDFIEGIKDNQSLNITEFDMPMLGTYAKEEEKGKIIKLTKNNLL